MKKLIEYKSKIQLRAFEYIIYIIFTNDIQQSVEKRAKFCKLKDDYVEPYCCGMHLGVGGRSISFLILPLDASINTMVHESFHAIWRLMKWVGASFEEEIMAYHLDYIVGEIFKFYLEKKLDKGRKK